MKPEIKKFTLLLLAVVIGLLVLKFWDWHKVNQKIENSITQIENDKDDESLTETYTSKEMRFTIKTPAGYTTDSSYIYNLGPQKEIKGIKFMIPLAMATGTNLSKDSYISVESISGTKSCLADMFLDGTHDLAQVSDKNKTYSFASSSNAGAGNRYEERVYAVIGTVPCIAVRYFVHYTVLANYPKNTVKEFDHDALIKDFDNIRRSLVVVQ